MSRLSVPCLAKINLHLRCGRPRADGFHPLLTWMCTVGLFDTLDVEAATAPPPPEDGGEAWEPSKESAACREAASDGVLLAADGEADRQLVALETDLPGLPCDGRNLVVRVADAWAREVTDVAQGNQGDAGRAMTTAAARVFPVRAMLRKRIPIGGGLGGGSSDAAHALWALDRLWNAGRAPAERLSAFAARFGSDLSFFFYAPSAVCRGRGEVVRPIDRPAARWSVLILPGTEMPTAAVYRKFDELGLGVEGRFGRDGEVADEPNWREWAALGAVPLLRRLVNDLEAPAFALDPALGHLRQRIESQLGRPVRMSGSGSSLFTLFDAQSEAEAAAEAIARARGIRALAVEVAPASGLP